MTDGSVSAASGVRPVEVVLVDDQAILVEAIVTQLGKDDRLKIIAAAGSSGEAERMFDRLDADVALIDMMLPDEPGEHLIKLLTQGAPRTRCIALSADESDEMMLRAIEAGAAGFLAKGSGTLDCIIHSVLSVTEGRLIFPPGRLLGLVQELATLPAGAPLDIDDGDRQLVDLLAQQLENDAIANALSVDVQEVQPLVSALMNRLNVTSPLQAVAAVARQGQIL